jgi:hypothetical protein
VKAVHGDVALKEGDDAEPKFVTRNVDAYDGRRRRDALNDVAAA